MPIFSSSAKAQRFSSELFGKAITIQLVEIRKQLVSAMNDGIMSAYHNEEMSRSISPDSLPWRVLEDGQRTCTSDSFQNDFFFPAYDSATRQVDVLCLEWYRGEKRGFKSIWFSWKEAREQLSPKQYLWMGAYLQMMLKSTLGTLHRIWWLKEDWPSTSPDDILELGFTSCYARYFVDRLPSLAVNGRVPVFSDDGQFMCKQKFYNRNAVLVKTQVQNWLNPDDCYSCLKDTEYYYIPDQTDSIAIKAEGGERWLCFFFGYTISGRRWYQVPCDKLMEVVDPNVAIIFGNALERIMDKVD